MSLLKDILRMVTHEIVAQVEGNLEGHAKKIVHRAIRVLVLSMVGLTFLAVGFVFLLFGAGTYLGQFMFSGLAWGLVGLIAALVGAVLLLLARR